jgi:hypothetical protein
MRKILVFAGGIFDYDTLQQKAFTDHFHFFFEEATSKAEHIEEFINNIVNKYRSEGLDGVFGVHDNPASYVAPIIAMELGLHGIDPAVAFLCHHKYYSREAQKRIVPFAVPEFQRLILDKLERKDVTISYPFFVKPVKSSFSILARSIECYETLEAFLPKARSQLADSIPLFNVLLKKYTEFEHDANCLIAEQILEGAQVTVEGFTWNGRVSIMGITDSVMYPGTMSFERFEYPSKLQTDVQNRMVDIVTELIAGMGLNYTMFNVELFYNKRTSSIHIIEINPRMAYQFADMFEKVDGTNSYALQLQLAQGEEPDFENGKGRYGVAASFVLRLFENKTVVRVPSEKDLRNIRALFPDALVIIKVKEGDRLSDLSQDETSYRYAMVNLGGRDWADLYTRFEGLKKHLCFEFAPALGNLKNELG